MDVIYHWRGEFESAEVSALHAEGFGHSVFEDDWKGQVARHSLGWVCARDGKELVGFVNVPWDGAIHAFILDTLVTGRLRRQGIGTRMIAIAVDEARSAGCEWLHADFDDDLRGFYFDSCGFAPTNAGVIALGVMPGSVVDAPPRVADAGISSPPDW
jgi:GNAT superfamily N-acetyltransferase